LRKTKQVSRLNPPHRSLSTIGSHIDRFKLAAINPRLHRPAVYPHPGRNFFHFQEFWFHVRNNLL
jgi:hypothetical protein